MVQNAKEEHRDEHKEAQPARLGEEETYRIRKAIKRYKVKSSLIIVNHSQSSLVFLYLYIHTYVREAAKKGSFFSGPATKRAGGGVNGLAPKKNYFGSSKKNSQK